MLGPPNLISKHTAPYISNEKQNIKVEGYENGLDYNF